MMSHTALQTAIVTCEQALHPTFRPEQFQPVAQRIGNILQSVGRFEEAVLWHTQAQLTAPDFASIYQGLGTIYVHQHRWEKAIAAYQIVLKHNPDIAAAYWQLAFIYRQQGQQGQALHYWFQALAFNPEEATLEQHVQLGHLLRKQGKIKESLNCYRRAICLNKDYVLAYRALAQGLRQQGRLTDAIAVYEEAVSRVEKPGLLYADLGRLFQDQGDWERAIATFQKGANGDVSYPWNHHHWANCLLQQEHWHDAIAVSSEAIERYASVPWAYVQMGRALIALERRDEAIICIQKACAVRGWTTCLSIGYEFSQDWFSRNIPIWTQHLELFIGQSDIKALEVGSFQGMSACWLLEHVLTHPSAHLTCIDAQFQPEFAGNIAKARATDKVTICQGQSEVLWSHLLDEQFDLIYLDGSKDPNVVQNDGQQAWQRLKYGGILIFDDYRWSNTNYPAQTPRKGIDIVLRDVKSQSTVLHYDYQVILRKNSSQSSQELDTSFIAQHC